MESELLLKTQSRSPDKHKTVLWAIFLALTLASLGFGIYRQFCPETVNCPANHDCVKNETDAAVWTMLLLIIPCVMQLFVAFHGRKKKEEKEETFMLGFFLLTFFSITSYSMPWWLYNLGVDNKYISYVCLLIILILVAILLRITSLFLHQEDTLFNDYTEGLRQLHFLAIVHFFAIFLSIAFIAGFALAFHDRASESHALYMEKTEFDKSLNTTQESGDILDEACFYFETPSANLSGTEITFRDKEPSSENVGKPENAIETRQHKNWESRRKIVDYIGSIYGKDKNKVPFIYLIGKTDPNIPVNNPYGNNLGLSQGRIDRTKIELKKELSEKKYALVEEIKWEPMAFSSNYNYTLFSSIEKQEANCPSYGEPNSNKRVVEIKVKFIDDLFRKKNSESEAKPLKVLDYMYFSIYTITTTGYGDIKPVTSLAKFICSIENIIEVFFLVIFVNILISFKESNAVDEQKGKTTPINNT